MSRAEDKPPPENVAEEVSAAADLLGDIITGRTTMREHAEDLAGRALEGLFGKKEETKPAGAPALRVHNGGKCS